MYPYGKAYQMSLYGAPVMCSYAYGCRRGPKVVIWDEFGRKMPVTTGILTLGPGGVYDTSNYSILHPYIVECSLLQPF